MKKGVKRFLVVLAALVILYFLGPAPVAPLFTAALPQVPENADSLEQFIKFEEAQHKLKPNNEARIVWANDSLKTPTEYSMVYIHGFSACQEEGNPVHRSIAKEFGCNLFLNRLQEHGIDTTEQLINLTADKLWESAKEALSIGKRLGKKVILMGTSTGGTLALKLASSYPNDVAGLVLYSPNVAINDPNAWILNNHWGLQLARLVKGGNYNTPSDERAIYSQYWNRPYRLEAVVALEELLETSMTETTFQSIQQPTLALYYYKDEEHQDQVVMVSSIKSMMQQLGTSESKKREVAMPKTEDHVLASPIRSKDVAGVKYETEKFLKEVVGLQQIQ